VFNEKSGGSDISSFALVFIDNFGISFFPTICSTFGGGFGVSWLRALKVSSPEHNIAKRPHRTTPKKPKAITLVRFISNLSSELFV
jgi:hypothetical protein